MSDITANDGDTALKALDEHDDPLACVGRSDTTFVLSWVADQSGFGIDGNWRTERLEFTYAASTRGELLEQVAAEIVRQDADSAFKYECAFGRIREIQWVSEDTIEADDLEDTMAFRLRREAREREARRQALAAERAADVEKQRRREAYEELKAEFGREVTIPEPKAPTVTDPAGMAAQAEMLARAERAAENRDALTWYDLSQIGDRFDVDGDVLVCDLIGRGYIRDLGVANSGGIFHGERMIALAKSR